MLEAWGEGRRRTLEVPAFFREDLVKLGEPELSPACYHYRRAGAVSLFHSLSENSAKADCRRTTFPNGRSMACRASWKTTERIATNPSGGRHHRPSFRRRVSSSHRTRYGGRQERHAGAQRGAEGCVRHLLGARSVTARPAELPGCSAWLSGDVRAIKGRRLDECAYHDFPAWERNSDQEEYSMKSLAFLEQVARDRKVAIYAAEHDGKLRSFAYHEGLGECRETFSRLLRGVQNGEIGVVMTPDAACLSIETSPDWMEAFIQAVKQHQVLIGDHSHDLVYDLREEEDEAQFRNLFPQGVYERARSGPRPLVDAIAQSPFAAASLERGENWFLVTDVGKKARDAPIYCLSSGARGKDADMWGMGPLKDLLDTLALYGITEGDGWSPVHAERKGWLSPIQRQEDAMAAQTIAALQPRSGSLPKGARRVGARLSGRGKARGKQRGKRGGRNR